MLPNRHNFCCDNLWKSIIMALKKPGKQGIFYSYFVATLYSVFAVVFRAETADCNQPVVL